jgi:hypothetical protein
VSELKKSKNKLSGAENFEKIQMNISNEVIIINLIKAIEFQRFIFDFRN